MTRLITLLPRPHMRPSIAAATVSALMLCTGCMTFGSLHSQTFIDPDKTFMLGGEQTAAFTVAGRNTGSVPIIVYAERAGTRDSVTTLAPGGTIDAESPARSIAVFRNTSGSQQAVVTLTARGATSNLSMRYEANRR